MHFFFMYFLKLSHVAVPVFFDAPCIIYRVTDYKMQTHSSIMCYSVLKKMQLYNGFKSSNPKFDQMYLLY
jgi:hypothetical protein